MNKFVYIRLFGDLNFFVPAKFHQRTIQLAVSGNRTVKDVVESIGVPHTEFELIALNGKITNPSNLVINNDRITVYPPFVQFEISGTTLQKPVHYKFVLDVHLGKLTALLRMLGFDCYYQNHLTDSEIIDIAIMENRIILSRDIGIFKNAKVKWGYFPRSQQPKLQLKEIVNRYNLWSEIKPFTRCISCNGEITKIDKKLITSELERNTLKYYQDFYTCTNCKKNYWKGSHYHKMLDFIHQFSRN